MLNDKIKNIREKFFEEVATVATAKELEDLRIKYLSRNGKFSMN